jgi:beta-glucosidase
LRELASQTTAEITATASSYSLWQRILQSVTGGEDESNATYSTSNSTENETSNNSTSNATSTENNSTSSESSSTNSTNGNNNVNANITNNTTDAIEETYNTDGNATTTNNNGNVTDNSGTNSTNAGSNTATNNTASNNTATNNTASNNTGTNNTDSNGGNVTGTNNSTVTNSTAGNATDTNTTTNVTDPNATSAPTPSPLPPVPPLPSFPSAQEIEDYIEELLQRMSLRDKIGQMIMDIVTTLDMPSNIASFIFDASKPLVNNTPDGWRKRNNELQKSSSIDLLNLQIPLIMAADAVHGQNFVQGGTIFPHNIGLGATRNTDLLRRIAEITAKEMESTGLDMTFAPTIAVARTETWGRTYESFGEQTDLVRSYTKPYIEAMQGPAGQYPWKKIAVAKHWIGDGGTINGTDRGNTTLDEETLMRIHGAPYYDAIGADVGMIMVSLSRVNNESMHGNEYYITQVLKNRMNFTGTVVTDWEGYLSLDGEYNERVQKSVNAGVDMLMCPNQGNAVIKVLMEGVESGNVSQSRIDDAARRVLRVKAKAGLMNQDKYLNENEYEPVGTPEHREVARQAVRESLVLLKNDRKLLPLDREANLFVAGRSADDMRNQCGGWTMTWQGTSNKTEDQVVGGTTILQALQKAGTGNITYSINGTGGDPNLHDVAVVVIGETPYAEFFGDVKNLSLSKNDTTVIMNVRKSGLPIVLVIVSGRPLVITNETKKIGTIVAAWLPGSEGDGVADVLYGDYDFTGRLSFSWPRDTAQVLDGFVGDNPDVLYPYDYGLNYDTTAAPSGPPVEETGWPTIAPTLPPYNLPAKPTPKRPGGYAQSVEIKNLWNDQTKALKKGLTRDYGRPSNRDGYKAPTYTFSQPQMFYGSMPTAMPKTVSEPKAPQTQSTISASAPTISPVNGSSKTVAASPPVPVVSVVYGPSPPTMADKPAGGLRGQPKTEMAGGAQQTATAKSSVPVVKVVWP